MKHPSRARFQTRLNPKTARIVAMFHTCSARVPYPATGVFFTAAQCATQLSTTSMSVPSGQVFQSGTNISSSYSTVVICLLWLRATAVFGTTFSSPTSRSLPKIGRQLFSRGLRHLVARLRKSWLLRTAEATQSVGIVIVGCCQATLRPGIGQVSSGTLGTCSESGCFRS